MSPLWIALGCLATLYLLGREFDRYGRNVRHAIVTPSRIEHVAPDEPLDSWVAAWEAAYAVDELEVLWKLPAREPVV